MAVRWILAFDGSCERCKNLATVVGDTVGQVIEPLPLASPTVTDLLSEAGRSAGPMRPTLIKAGDHVRAWTGTGMMLRLTLLLGPSKAVKLVRAIGKAEPNEARDASRRAFLGFAPRGALALGVVTITGGALAGRGSRGRDGDLPELLQSRALARDTSSHRAAKLDLLANGQSDDNWDWDQLYVADYRDQETSLAYVPRRGQAEGADSLRYLMVALTGEGRAPALEMTLERRSETQASVTWGAVDGTPLVGFDIDLDRGEMKKVIHPAARNTPDDEFVYGGPGVFAAGTTEAGPYWDCVAWCLGNVWNSLPWYTRWLCGGACSGCLWSKGAAAWACFTCVPCLAGYALGCTAGCAAG